MRQFAEQEFVVPDGDYAGTKYRPEVQPAHALWLDEIDSGRWREHYLLASQQSGKSVAGFLIPLFYHLFELRQTVILGVPLLDLRKDKWDMEVMPALEASRYRDLIPLSGAGSKGGVAALMKFQHGAAIRWMTGGGSDKTRSSFTSPVLITTETEGFGEVSVSSGENVTPLDQLRGRTSFYGSRAKIYHECTVQRETGIMWQGHLLGSGGQVVFPCPSCGAAIHPEREHLVGWLDRETELRAKHATRWSCPACGILFDEAARKKALKQARLLHRGESFGPDGAVIGTRPETEVLSVRYGASANAFSEAGIIGVQEWKIRYQQSADAGEATSRALNQWTYAMPIKEDSITIDPLDVQRLLMRQGGTPRGTCPAGTYLLTAGCDIRKTQLHHFVIAWRHDAGPCVVEFGIESVPSHDLPLGEAILVAGEAVQEIFRNGFPVEGGGILSVALTLADCGYETDAVEILCSKDSAWLPAKGFGSGVLRDKKYIKPRSEKSARIIGNGWHIAEVRGRNLVELDANKQKSALHRALSVEDQDSPHALIFCSANQQDLREMVYELTAEEQKDIWKPGAGLVTEWKVIRKRNHYLDAASQSYVAKTVFEELVRLIESEQAQQQPEEIEWTPVVSGSRGGIFG